METEYTWSIEDKAGGVFYRLAIKDYGWCSGVRYRHCPDKIGLILKVHSYSLNPDGKRDYLAPGVWFCIPCAVKAFQSAPEVLARVRTFLEEHPDLALEN